MLDYKQLTRRKISTRKMGQVSPRTKKAHQPTVFLLIVGALIIGASFGVHSFLLHFPGFKVSKVSIVDADGEMLQNPEHIFRLDENLNLFSLDIKRFSQDIQTRHPQLLSVLIRKQFPNTLLIIVNQRKPVAIVGMKKSCLTDERGFILPYGPAYGHLPEIVGIHPREIQLYAKAPSLRLKKALNLLKELKKAKIYPQYKVSQIDVRQYSNIIFYLDSTGFYKAIKEPHQFAAPKARFLENKIEVKMGKSDFGRKATLLSGILTQLKTNDTVPKYIDMRFDNPAVMP